MITTYRIITLPDKRDAVEVECRAWDDDRMQLSYTYHRSGEQVDLHRDFVLNHWGRVEGLEEIRVVEPSEVGSTLSNHV